MLQIIVMSCFSENDHGIFVIHGGESFLTCLRPAAQNLDSEPNHTSIMDVNQQVVLITVILAFMASGHGDSAVERLESVREGIRNILSVTGLRQSMASLCLIWKCITSAKIARDRGQAADSFTFVESAIASAAPSRYCYQLSNLASQPWASHLAQELESDADTLRDLLGAIPAAELELRESVEDACLILGDAFDMIECRHNK